MLVFDFGGGTLDVTVMQAARGGAFKVGILPFARC
jgi:molecular chaperone DnaK (HSP70)